VEHLSIRVPGRLPLLVGPVNTRVPGRLLLSRTSVKGFLVCCCCWVVGICRCKHDDGYKNQQQIWNQWMMDVRNFTVWKLTNFDS
jgi:hypothetical protein